VVVVVTLVCVVGGVSTGRQPASNVAARMNAARLLIMVIPRRNDSPLFSQRSRQIREPRTRKNKYQGRPTSRDRPAGGGGSGRSLDLAMFPRMTAADALVQSCAIATSRGDAEQRRQSGQTARQGKSGALRFSDFDLSRFSFLVATLESNGKPYRPVAKRFVDHGARNGSCGVPMTFICTGTFPSL
jgi:hypothetical protein